MFARLKEIVCSLFARLKGSDLFKGFAITTVGSGLSKAIMIAATFYCTHTLTQEEFGEFSFINNTLVMILTICASNFSRLCTKFATEAKSSDESIQRLFILFLFSLAACILASLLVFILPDTALEYVFGDSDMLSFLRFAALLLPLFMLQPLIEGVLRGLMRFKLICVVQVLSAIFYLVALIVGIKLDGIDGAIVALLVFYATSAMVFLSCLLKIVPVSSFNSKLIGFDKQWRVLPHMILPVFLASFVEAPLFWILQLLLTKNSTVADVGGMTVMKQIRNFALLIPNYFFSTYIAFAGKMNSERNYREYFSQFDKLNKYFFLLGIGVSLLFSLICKPVLWLYHPEYVGEWRSLVISNTIIPFALVLNLVKSDLILQEHQRALLFISIGWNFIWIGMFLLLIRAAVLPLNAFFYGELLAVIVQLACCYLIYMDDKKKLLRISNG